MNISVNTFKRRFAYWLKGKGAPPAHRVVTFETGVNSWKSWDAWPPGEGVKARKLYLHGNGQLSFDPPAPAATASDSYISDPANPVPYRHRPVEATYSEGSRWYPWLTRGTNASRASVRTPLLGKPSRSKT